MAAISPQSLENVAQSYARLIKAGEKTLSDVPTTIQRVYDRVQELIS